MTQAWPEGTISDAAYRRRWWTLAVLCLSLVVITLDNTILNVALPTLVRDLNATTSQLQWFVDAYTLAFAGLLLTAGSLGDRYGRRGALTLGLVIFGLGSIASAFAGTPAHLIVTRTLMGVGGAFIMPSTLSILTNTFAPAERGRAIGVWAGVSALGVAIGPLTGGFLLAHFSWGSVFWVNVPVVVIAIVLGRFLVPTSRDPRAPRLDLVGAALSIGGLSLLLYAIIEAPGWGWLASETIVLFAVALVILAGFAWWELRSDHPMLDVRFFENPRFTAASLAVTMVFFAMFGATFLFTQYMQFVLGYTALETGVRVIPMAAVIMVVAPSSARLVERWGTKLVVTSGLAIVAVGLTLFLRSGVATGYGPFLVALLVMGTGMALTMAPATDSIMGSLPLAKAGVGSAVNDTTRQLGGALGVGVLGSVLASIYGGRVAAVLPATVPAPAAAAIKGSLGAALEAASRVGGDVGARLAAVANGAFVDAMHVGVLVGAVIAVLGAMTTALFLPARPAEEGVTGHAAPAVLVEPEAETS